MDQIIGKVLIGTANFNSSYGISENREPAERLLSSIWNFGIRKLDLSNKYIFGLKDLSNEKHKWQIQLKIQVDTSTPDSSYLRELDFALSNLNNNCIERILIHNGDEFLYKNDIRALERLFRLTPDSIRFGISLYDLPNLEKIIEQDFINIIQFPANVFDRRFANLKTENKKQPERKGKIFQARSIFLQGLLLNNYSKFPQNLKQFKNVFGDWYLWNLKHKYDLLESSINEVFIHQDLDEFTIGIDTSAHLNQLTSIKLNQMRYSIPSNVPDIIIDPRKWVL
jgi:aryl-alcohol dehydrogenase-like predicted oxidoreductase